MGRARIDSLSQSERDMLPSIAQEWIDWALSTVPADRAAVEDGMRRCYEAAGLAWHGNVVWCPDPLTVSLAGPIAAHLLGGSAVHGAVGVAVGVAVGSAVSGVVDSAVRGAVGDAVDGAVHSAVGGAVHDAVSGVVDSAVGVAVRGAVHDAVGDAVDGTVGGAVRDAVDGAVHGAVGDAVGGAWWQVLWGRHGLWWIAWQDTFRRLDLSLDADTWALLDANIAANSAGRWWPHEQFIIVCDTPAVINLEQIGPAGRGSHQLHNPTGPSISWRDGWALHHWHGTPVPADLLDGWSTEQILAEPNTEIRRCAIEVTGWDRFLADLGVAPIDTCDDPGNPGQMLALYDLPDAAQPYDEPVRLLACVNGTRYRTGERGRFGLTVPADTTGALEAAAWTYGLPADVYAGMGRRT